MTPNPQRPERRYGQPTDGRPPLQDSTDWRLLGSHRFTRRTIPVVNGEFRGYTVTTPYVSFIAVIPLSDPNPFPRLRLFRWLP